MVPLASLVLPLAILLQSFGWVNTYWGLIFPYAALGVPFGIVILKAFMEGFPANCSTLRRWMGATPGKFTGMSHCRLYGRHWFLSPSGSLS